MKTLINGACFSYNMIEYKKELFNYKDKYLLCFKNWIKDSGEPSEHIVNDESDNQTCDKHYVLCEGSKSNLIYNRQKSLYNIDEIYNYTEESIKEITPMSLLQ